MGWVVQSVDCRSPTRVAATGRCWAFATGWVRLGLGFNCIIITLNSVINTVLSMFGTTWVCEFTFASLMKSKYT